MPVTPIDGLEGAGPVAEPPRVEPAPNAEIPAVRRAPDASARRAASPGTRADALDVSKKGRELALDAIRLGRNTGLFPSMSAGARTAVAEAVGMTDLPSVRELQEQFAHYDNRTAVANFRKYLSASAAYGGAGDLIRAAAAEVALRDGERAVEALVTAAGPEIPSAGERGLIGGAVDRWMTGAGVFLPQFSGYASSDGIQFAPFSAEAEAALRFAEVFATGERDHIAAYLLEMSQLAPSDFLFYDPTGLGTLIQQERRSFLNRIDELLAQLAEQSQPPEGVQPRAAELRYAFDESGRLDFSLLGDREREVERYVRDAIAADRTGAAASTVASLIEYGMQIVAQD